MVSTYLFGALGYKALFLFCGLSYLMAAMCFLWMPETTGKTLEDIDDMYERPYRSFKVDRS